MILYVYLKVLSILSTFCFWLARLFTAKGNVMGQLFQHWGIKMLTKSGSLRFRKNPSFTSRSRDVHLSEREK